MVNEDMYQQLCNAATTHSILYHYTDIDALKHIVSEKAFRLSRLDLVNDLYEKERVIDLYEKKIYIGCFTHRESESIYFWRLYPNNQPNKHIRLAIQQEFLQTSTNWQFMHIDNNIIINLERAKNTNLLHMSYEQPDDWAVYDCCLSDVHYTDDFTKHTYIDTVMKKHFLGAHHHSNGKFIPYQEEDFIVCKNPGLIKGIEWDDESETRIRVTLKPKGKETYNDGLDIKYRQPSFNYIHLTITDTLLSGMEITLNPWADKSFENDVRNILEQSGFPNISVRKSSVYKKVK